MTEASEERPKTRRGLQETYAALLAALKATFTFYLQAHIFHWNVMGPDFPQLHEFFGKLYADAHEAVDDLAEHIRALGFPAPMHPDALIDEEAFDDTGSSAMVQHMLEVNESVRSALYDACDAATDVGQAGIANFLQERIDKHAKWGWMLRATVSR